MTIQTAKAGTVTAEPPAFKEAARSAAGKIGTERRLAVLRERIARIGAGGGNDFVPPAPLVGVGLDDIDRHLPGGGLARGAVHEIVAAAAPGAANSINGGFAADMGGAALGFALWLIARMTGDRPWLWCAQDAPHRALPASLPYAPGLADFGLKPRRLVLARTAFERETLWAAEEGLATPALGAVLAEVGAVSDIAARRLALAARESRVPLILLRPDNAAAIPAASRWRVGAAPSAANFNKGGSAAAPSAADLNKAVPEGAWEIALVRAGGAFPRRWRVVWHGGERLTPLPVPAAPDHDHENLPSRHQTADAAGARPVAAASARGAA